MFLFADMFEDPVWCFLNMRREMKVGDSRFESANTFGRVESKQLECTKSFPSNWTRATKEKKKKQNYNNSNNKSFLLTYLPGKPVISIGADNPLFNPIVHSLLQTLSKWNNKIKRTQLQTTQQGKHWGIVLGILKSVKVLFKKKLAALSATFQESSYLVAGIITSHSPQKRKVSHGWW